MADSEEHEVCGKISNNPNALYFLQTIPPTHLEPGLKVLPPLSGFEFQEQKH